METALLQTKFYIPPTRPDLVLRLRLIERLNASLGQSRHFARKLSLISAPAGFGKTTLVSEWVQALGGTDPPIAVAWLSLDESDNDLTRFLTYFVTALQTIEAGIGKGALSALQSPQPPPAEGILTALINEIAAISTKIILVLDDWHLIETQPIHDALAFLLRRLPPQLHLVIATREDPPLPLARLRVRGQLTELRAADLRFTPSEAGEFLNQVMDLGLAADDITALESRTEGWIAGLRLAALALQGPVSMQGSRDSKSFVQSFAGSHRYVLDYLVEEVLELQSQSIQDFLLQTAILNRLTGPLCDALTDQGNGQETLQVLEQTNLFIVSLDEERRWYRYHHLFAELLLKRLSLIQPDSIGDLHSKAATWHEAHGDLSEAIYHALAARDTETATRLIEKGALEALKRGELRLILTWIDRLPDAAFASSPLLFIHHTWVLLIIGQLEVVRSRIENIDWVCNAIKDTDEKQKVEVLGLVAGLKAILMLWDRDYTKGLEFANQALENLPKDNWVAGYCAIVAGFYILGKWRPGFSSRRLCTILCYRQNLRE